MGKSDKEPWLIKDSSIQPVCRSEKRAVNDWCIASYLFVKLFPKPIMLERKPAGLRQARDLRNSCIDLYSCFLIVTTKTPLQGPSLHRCHRQFRSFQIFACGAKIRTIRVRDGRGAVEAGLRGGASRLLPCLIMNKPRMSVLFTPKCTSP